MTVKPRGSVLATTPDHSDFQKTPPPGGPCDKCGRKVSRYNPYKTRCNPCVDTHGPPKSAQERAWILRQKEQPE